MMSYKFQGTSYATKWGALRAVADAWIYAGMACPYPETLDEAPEHLAAECIEGWGLQDLLADWDADATALADAMASILRVARAEAVRANADDAK
jgi:hypothetical protein